MKLLSLLGLFVLLIGGLYVLTRVLEQRKKGAGSAADDVPRAAEFPYEESGPLLSEGERAFLPVLEAAAREVSGGEARIAVQVPVSKLIKVRGGVPASERAKWHNQIDRKTIDFVLLDREWRARIAVELDDRSHDAAKRVTRDEFVEAAFRAAGVRLVRVRCAAGYEREAVARMLKGEAVS